MTETTRIRWHGEPDDGDMIGCVGTLNPAAFRIWEASEGGEWLLTSILPGHEGDRTYGATPDELKAEAERWLEEFTSSLGAVFPEPELPECRCTLSVECPACRAAPATPAPMAGEKESGGE